MNTISVPRSEYEMLKAQATAYVRLLKSVATESIVTPPTRSRSMVMKELKKIGKYNKNFLKSLEKGLEESTFFSNK